jgi:hypothetical protein
MQEKIRRKDKVDVDIAIVEILKRHQRSMNHYFKNSGRGCNLYPRKNLYPCSVCSKYGVCITHKKERDYIKGEVDSYKTSKRRERKSDKGKEKDHVLNSHEAKESKYPCEPFDFGCPNKDDCNEGQSCSWKE